MRRPIAPWVGACLILVGVRLEADEVLAARQTVNLIVDAIQRISINGPATLRVTTATAGQAPTAAADTTTTYSITSNNGTVKITAHLDAALPAGMAITLTAMAPSGGQSLGKKALSLQAVDVVNAVGKVSETKLLSYQLTATAAAGPLPTTTRTVILTIAADGGDDH